MFSVVGHENVPTNNILLLKLPCMVLFCGDWFLSAWSLQQLYWLELSNPCHHQFQLSTAWWVYHHQLCRMSCLHWKKWFLWQIRRGPELTAAPSDEQHPIISATIKIWLECKQLSFRNSYYFSITSSTVEPGKFGWVFTETVDSVPMSVQATNKGLRKYSF